MSDVEQSVDIEIKDHMIDLNGVYPRYITTDKRRMSEEYRIYSAMKQRCSVAEDSKKDRTYFGCSMSALFLDYYQFARWCNLQVGFKNIDMRGFKWQLDKDLLVVGNKTYSEDTCVFLPQNVNQFLKTGRGIRGDLPIGVTFHKKSGKYYAQCRDGTRGSNYLASFSTPEEAFHHYKSVKEHMAKRIAEDHQDIIDPRAYDALMKFTVSISD